MIKGFGPFYAPLEFLCEGLYHNACSDEPIECHSGRRTQLHRGAIGYIFIDSINRRGGRMSISPYFCSTSLKIAGDRLSPKLLRASASSRPSIDPERSLSKRWKTPRHSPIYLKRLVNSTLDNEVKVCNPLRKLHTVKSNSSTAISTLYTEMCRLQVRTSNNDVQTNS
jgi:hypothetical protein